VNKIPCVFRREFTARGKPTMFPEPTPGCEWVLAGEGVATRKWDGTACMVRGGKLFRHYDAKGKGEWRPPGFIPCEGLEDSKSKPGWIPVDDGPEDRWHREAWAQHMAVGAVADGTYELIGPKLQGNPERTATHVLARHGIDPFPDAPRTFDGLRAWLAERDIEGLVFHHSDGRMAKIRKADFGLARPTPDTGGET
jgi:hypothetical protein